MSTIASLVATLGLDSSGFNKGIDGAKESAGGLEKSLSGFKSVALVGATTAVVGLGAGLASSVGVAATFEKQIDAVGAVSGATDGELAMLSKTALRIGQDTAFGATEMAGGMEIMASSGLSATQIIDGAADAVASLAAAGGTNLATAAGVASTAMGVWGLKSNELTDVVNRVAGAANVSKFGVEDMAGAMAMGGGAAASAGVSFEDFSTTIGATAKYFSSGSDAGTSFKTFLSRLAAPTDKAAAAMADLGINAFDSSGNMKSMGEIAGILESAMGPLSEEQRAQAMATIFGADATRTAIGLMEQGAEGFTTMSDVMKNTDAAAVAAQRMGNFSGAMDQVKGAIETLQIKIGTALLPILTELGLKLATAIPAAASAVAAGFASMMAATEPFRAAIASVATSIAEMLLPKLQEFGGWFAGNQDAMMMAGAAIGTVLVGAFLALAVAAGSAAVGVIAATLPFIAIIAVAAALGAGIYLLVKHWDTIVEKFPLAGAALDGVKAGWASILSWIQGTFMPGISKIADAIMEAGSRAAGFVRSHWTEIQTIINGVLTFIGTLVADVFQAMGGVISGALQIISGIIKVFTGLLSGDWAKTWEGLKEIAGGIWTAISAVVQLGIDTIKNVISNLGPALSAIMSMGWDLLKNVAQAAWDGIKAAVSAGVDALPGLLSAAGGAMKSAMSAAWDAIKSAASAAWDGIKSAVSSAVGAIPGLLSAAAGGMLSAGKALFEAVWEGAKAIWSAIAGWVPTLPGIAADFIKAGAGLLLSAGERLLNALWNGAKGIWTTVGGWLVGLPGEAKAWLETNWPYLKEAGIYYIEKLWDGLKEKWADAIAWFGELPAKVVEGIGDLGGLLKDAGVKIIQGLIDGIQSKIGDLTGKLGEITDKIPDWKGPASTDATLLYESGRLIIGGLVAGIDSAVPGVEATLVELTSTIDTTTATGLDGVAQTVNQKWADIDRVQVEGIDDANRNGAAKLQKMLDSMVQEQDKGMARFVSTNRDLLDSWRGALMDGLDEGRVMSAAEINDMLDDIAGILANDTSLPASASDAISDLLIGMVDQFNVSGNLPNAALLDVIAKMLNTLDTAPLPETAQTVGWDIGGGFIAGVNAQGTAVAAATAQMGNNAIGALVATMQTSSPSKVTYQIGMWTASGFQSGIEDGTPAVVAAITDMGAVTAIAGEEAGTTIADSVTQGIVDGLAAGEIRVGRGAMDNVQTLVDQWATIEAQMQTINETAATAGGAAYASKWHKSMLDGMNSGMVSLATAVEIMNGVIQSSIDPFNLGGAPQSSEWVRFYQEQLKALAQNNTQIRNPRMPITGEAVDAIRRDFPDLYNPNWNTDGTMRDGPARRVIEDDAIANAVSDGDMWVPSDDTDGFSSGDTYITVTPTGYYNGPDQLIRDINGALVQSGARPLVQAP